MKQSRSGRDLIVRVYTMATYFVCRGENYTLDPSYNHKTLINEKILEQKIIYRIKPQKKTIALQETTDTKKADNGRSIL